MSDMIPAMLKPYPSFSDSEQIVSDLRKAQMTHSQQWLADYFGVTNRHVRRWIAGETTPPPYVGLGLQRLLPLNTELASERSRPDFTFVDLFAGIGGIRMAFEKAGGECVFTSEWDSYAQKTYAANFGLDHAIHGDITQIDAADVPDHDVLLAGFPCQPFSIAGVSKKTALGRAHGFADETQGTLFFDVARIIAAKRPKAFMLENVKNLQSHDKGRTFNVILRTLRDELGYQVSYKVIDGAHWVPQHRERIIIVGFREPNDFNWDSLNFPEKGQKKLGSILHVPKKASPTAFIEEAYQDVKTGLALAKYTLTDNLWGYLQAYKTKHQLAGNGFGFGLVDANSVTRTLSARYYKDGSEILLDQGTRRNPRRLTPRECARLMGFPDSFKIPVSDTRAYKQFGNSVVVPVIVEVAQSMREFIMSAIQSELALERKVA